MFGINLTVESFSHNKKALRCMKKKKKKKKKKKIEMVKDSTQE